MSAIKYLLEAQREIYGGVAVATGTPSLGGFTEGEMEMGRYDHNSAEERMEMLEEQEYRWGEEREVEE